MNPEIFTVDTLEVVKNLDTLALIGHYINAEQRTLESIHLLNLGPGLALIKQFGISAEHKRIGTNVVERLEPGKETLLFDVSLIKAWIGSLSARENGRLERMLSSGENHTISVFAQIVANGQQFFDWPAMYYRDVVTGEYRVNLLSSNGS